MKKIFIIILIIMLTSCRVYIKNESVIYDKMTVREYNQPRIFTLHETYPETYEQLNKQCVYFLRDVVTRHQTDFVDSCDKFSVGDVVSYQIITD